MHSKSRAGKNASKCFPSARKFVFEIDPFDFPLSFLKMMNVSRIAASDSARKLGSVKWFDMKKGYGFITPKEGSGIDGEVFVHQTNVISATGFRTLYDGLDVAFSCRTGKLGRAEAYDVSMADGTPVKVEATDRR